MISGKLVFWSDKKNFGYVEVQRREGGGIYLEKFFLHRTNITFTTVETPQAGSIVLFEAQNVKATGDRFPHARNAMVFDSQEKVDFYLTATTAEGGVK
jgi:cold shock CspA family protein